MQAASREHKDFGQRVVSDEVAVPERQDDDERRLPPAQAAARFPIPEYLLRKACADGRLISTFVSSTRSGSRQMPYLPSRASGAPRMGETRNSMDQLRIEFWPTTGAPGAAGDEPV